MNSETKTDAKIQELLKKYKALRADGYNHAAASMATIQGRRDRNTVNQFLALPEVQAESKAFNETLAI
jgi:hypothetical protein